MKTWKDTINYLDIPSGVVLGISTALMWLVILGVMSAILFYNKTADIPMGVVSVYGLMIGGKTIHSAVKVMKGEED